MVEAFLRFSPRVQYRAPGFVFIDITSTTSLFHSEQNLLRLALELCHGLGFEARAAISDSAYGAQVFATQTGLARSGLSAEAGANGFVCPKGEEKVFMDGLSLPHLLQMEGLEAWSQSQAVQKMISFFLLLGMTKVSDVRSFHFSSMQERWGDAGSALWRRLQGEERQVVSPLIPNETLHEYFYFDDPVSLLPLLLHRIEGALKILVYRMQGRRLVVKNLTLSMRCEYSDKKHQLVFEPSSPHRNAENLLELLEHRLEKLDFENPIRDFDLDVQALPETEHQFDFFEPRRTDHDRMQHLLTVLKQEGFSSGYFKLHKEILPEKSWSLSHIDELRSSTSEVHKSTRAPSNTHSPQTYQQLSFGSSDKQSLSDGRSNIDTGLLGAGAGLPDVKTCLPDRKLKYQPVYSDALPVAPRPSRVLARPHELDREALRDIQILTRDPIERMESGWWNVELDQTNTQDQQNDGASSMHTHRDYYFAVSNSGQCLWLYKDLQARTYLQGYFD